MEGSSSFVDISSFLLFEASGDSEASDSDPYSVEMEIIRDYDDGGDAESCSYDSSDFLRVLDLDGCDDDLVYGNRSSYGYDDHGDDLMYVDRSYGYDDDDHDGEVDGGGHMVKSGQQNRSGVCIDSAMELVNEMENNRLFWETCLAS